MIKKVFIKIILYVFAFILCALLSIPLLLQSAPVKNYLKELLVSEAGKALNAEFSIKNLGGNLFTSVILEGVSMKVENGKFIDVDSIKINYLPLALLSKKIRVNMIVLENPSVYFLQNKEDKWNYNLLGRKSQEAAGKAERHGGTSDWSVSAGLLTLKNASLLIRSNKSGPQVLLSHVDIEADAGLSPGFKDLIVKRLNLKTALSEIHIKGEMKNLADPDFDLDLKAPSIAFKDIRVWAPGLILTGSAKTEIALKGPLDNLHIDQKLAYRNAQFDNTGVLNLKKFSLFVDSRIRRFDPRIVAGSFPAGELNLDLLLNSNGFDVSSSSLSASVSFRPSKLADVSLRKGVCRLAIDKGYCDLSLEGLETSLGTISIESSGEIAGAAKPSEAIAVDLSAGLTGLDLSKIFGKGYLESSINSTLSVRVVKAAGKPIKDSMVAGLLAVDSSTISGISVESAGLNGRYENGILKFDYARLYTGPVDLEASGTFSAKEEIDISYKSAIRDLGIVNKAARLKGVSGSASISGSLKGSLEDLSAVALIDAKELSYSGFAVGTLHSNASMELSGPARELSGSADLDARDIRAGNREFNELAVKARADRKVIELSGALTADAERSAQFTGRIDARSSGRTVFSLNKLLLKLAGAEWANDGDLSFSLDHGALEVSSFALSGDGQRVTASGRLNLSAASDLTLDLKNLKLDEMERIAGYSEGNLSGALNARVRVQGTRASPQIDCSLELSSGSLKQLSYDSIASTVSFREKRLGLGLEIKKDGDTLFFAGGSLPVDLSLDARGKRFTYGDMDFLAKARHIDMSAIPLFLKPIEKAAGLLDMSVSVKGDPLKPVINANASVNKGFLLIRGANTPYTDIDLNIIAVNDKITLDHIRMRSGQGRAELKGTLTLNKFKPDRADLYLSASNFKIMDSEIIAGAVDADVHLTGPLAGLTVTGEVKLRSAQYNLEKQASLATVKEISFIEKGRAVKNLHGSAGSADILTGMTIDGKVTMDRDVWIRGMGLNAELSGSANITKDPDKAVIIVGKLTTLRGTFEFQGTVLSITDGSILFQGGPKLDPFLNMTASTRIQDITAIVQITGNISKPTVLLTSDPPRDQSEVLSYLMFGKSSAKLTEAESQVLSQTTANFVASAAIKSLREFLPRGFAPDLLQVRPEAQGGFAVGKYITNDLFLRYEFNYGVNAAQTILDYRINDRFDLQSQFGDETTSGADIFWKHNY
jgi:autotransporter translocation and assembly factor TamB